MLDLQETPHRRLNILTGDWVLVSPHRAKRPWQGKTEETNKVLNPKYDPNCYLCPGNTRANGVETPTYTNTFTFQNDFSALLWDVTEGSYSNDLLIAESEKGICRVICFSPDHSKTMADLGQSEIISVINTWQKEYLDLSKIEGINWVQIFENKGAIMGCSNPHPHGQIWAHKSLPQEVVNRNEHFNTYYKKTGTSILSNYIKQELEINERIVSQNDSFLALVPFWAVWPFEIMIVAKRHVQHIGQLSPKEISDYALILSDVTKRYDALFNTSFPYSSGIYQSPSNEENNVAWHFHMNFYPPLLRSATVKKFMVGYELFANPQRDISPESAAQSLKRVYDKTS